MRREKRAARASTLGLPVGAPPACADEITSASSVSTVDSSADMSSERSRDATCGGTREAAAGSTEYASASRRSTYATFAACVAAPRSSRSPAEAPPAAAEPSDCVGDSVAAAAASSDSAAEVAEEDSAAAESGLVS